MSEPAKPIPRATSYGWRLLMLVPAVLLCAYGYWRQIDVAPGGTVNSIRLTAKPDIAGQVRDAYASVDPRTSDYFLQVQKRDGGSLKTNVFGDTQLGNGLTWPLESPLSLGDVSRVEVWDHNSLLPDKQLDRVELDGMAWSATGQTYQVSLIGTRPEPPRWAMPLMAVGATLGAVVLLKFVWDQAL